jgi:hypothetical protein
MADVVAPSPLETLGADGLKRIIWAAKKAKAQIQRDPFVTENGIFGMLKPGKDGSFTAMPGKVVQAIEQGGGVAHAKEVRLQIDMPLDNEGVSGRDEMQGNETEVKTKWASIKSNDIMNAITVYGWGADKMLKDPTDLDETSKQALITWSVEKEGFQKRQALLENVSEELLKEPAGTGTQTFNANILFPNLDLSQQPAYHPTPATHVTNITTAMDLQSSADTHFTIRNSIKLANQLEEKYMRPAMIGNRSLWLLYLHPHEFAEFENTGIDGSWGNWVKQIGAQSSYKDLHEILPHAEFIISNRLLVLKDEKAPILGRSGGVLTPYYKKFFETDDRKDGVASETNPFRVNEIMGESALVKHNPVAWNIKTEKSNFYGKRVGVMYQAQQSFQTLRYDLDAAVADDTTMYQRTSAILLTAAKEW